MATVYLADDLKHERNVARERFSYAALLALVALGIFACDSTGPDPLDEIASVTVTPTAVAEAGSPFEREGRRRGAGSRAERVGVHGTLDRCHGRRCSSRRPSAQHRKHQALKVRNRHDRLLG